jgi:hypothetical protein
MRKSGIIPDGTTFSTLSQYLAYASNIIVREIPRHQKASICRTTKCNPYIHMVNQQKTKHMVASCGERIWENAKEILIHGNQFEMVTVVKYLGPLVTEDDDINIEIKYRLSVGDH